MDPVQIVPTLPPAVSGVGDYATLLARELLTRHGVGTRFIAGGDPGWDAPAAVAPFPAAAVRARSADALCALLDGAGVVLLHYVPYGYANRGCPFWLVDAVERWKRTAGPSCRLLLFFHEVYATGPPWSSAFWTHPFQRWLAARLARAADARRITTTISRRELHGTLGRRRHDLPATIAPVFSNMGEPADPPPSSARERQLVVFGSRHVREAVYTHAAALEVFCARHEIRRVVDVGAPIPGGVRLGGGLEVRETGVLPAAAASALFSQSLAGYFSYPAPYLGKSGTFAAYCAHRMTPVTFPGNVGALDGLRAGEHYLEGPGGDAPFDAVADAAHAWYRTHRLQVHADDTYQLLST